MMVDKKRRISENDFFQGELEWEESKEQDDSAVYDIFQY